MPRRRTKKPPATLMSFPATLRLRVTGYNQDGFTARVLEALQTCQPGLDGSGLSMQPSREGKYLAVTVTLTVHSQLELEALYQSLRGVEGLILAV